MTMRSMRWIVWSLAVLFLFYEFIVRVYPSVMVRELMTSFSVNATALGTLSAFFFYAYAPLQLPIGILLDRFGLRYILTLSALFCGIGCVMFGLSTQIGQAQGGRFLMGVGSAIAFIGMVYVCSHWFPKKKLAMLVGIGNSLGMLGAAWGVGPFDIVVKLFGWETTILFLGIIGLFLAAIIFICVRKEPPVAGEERETLRSAWRHFGLVMKNWRIWLNSIIALLFYMTTGAFASLWAVPFLEKVFNVQNSLATSAASMVFIGWIAGGPLIGWFSDRARSRKWVVIVSALLTGGFLTPIIYDTHLSMATIYLFMFLVGFFSSGQLLNFSFAVEMIPSAGKGSAIAVTNFIVSAGTAIIQPLVGYLLDRFWTGEMEAGVRLYSTGTYQKALTIFPLMIGLSILLMLFLREPKRLSHEEIDQAN